MLDVFMYYTLQGDFTLEILDLFGTFSSPIENKYYLIDLVKNNFKSKGIVYYFKVSKSYVGELPTSGRGSNLIKLNGKTLSKNRIEFTGDKFSKALMMCDALCNSRFLGDLEEDVREPSEKVLPRLIKTFSADFNFFKEFGKGESQVYVGLIDKITDEDVLEVIKDYR